MQDMQGTQYGNGVKLIKDVDFRGVVEFEVWKYLVAYSQTFHLRPKWGLYLN